MTVYLQRVSGSGTLDLTALPYILSASGSGGFRSGWPTCRIVLPTMPATGGINDLLNFTAMGEQRFKGYCTGIERDDAQMTVTLLGSGLLALADEPAARQTNVDGQTPESIIDAIFVTPTDEHIAEAVLRVVGVPFGVAPGIFGGTGSITQPDGSPWPKWAFGETAWSYVQRIDRLSGYRTWTHLVDGYLRTEAIYGSGALTEIEFNPTNVFRGATAGQDRYRRAALSTYLADALSWSDGHTLALPTLDLDLVAWCQDLSWQITPHQWTQSPNYATAPE